MSPRLIYYIPREIITLLDLCIVTGCFFLGYAIRNGIDKLYPLSLYIGTLPVILLIWGALMKHYFSGYSTFRSGNISEILFMVFKAALLGFTIFSGFTYLFKLEFISRTLVLLIFSLSAIFIAAEKLSLILILQNIRKKGYNTRNMMIVGTGKRARQFVERVHKNTMWGYKIIGLVDDRADQVGQLVYGYRVLGTLKEMPEIVHENVIDEVVFIVPRSWLERIEPAMLLCESEGINVNLAVDIFDLKLSNSKSLDMDGFPLLTFKTTTDKFFHLLIKRTFDVVMSGAALLLLSPVYLAVAWLIRRTSPGPIFFRQERCGLHGRKFTLYKFRTMVIDAEQRLKELMLNNEMSGPAFKMENDPRITPIGKFLRKYSIDELPQLWNVFMGDMSLVGPRPPIPSEVNHYDCWHRRRLSMRPGITCLWQVNGRNKITDFNEWVKLDLEYIDNWSLWLEFKILMKTIPAVFSGAGAK